MSKKDGSISYTFTFNGVPKNLISGLEAQLEADAELWPTRVSMESATVERVGGKLKSVERRQCMEASEAEAAKAAKAGAKAAKQVANKESAATENSTSKSNAKGAKK